LGVEWAVWHGITPDPVEQIYGEMGANKSTTNNKKKKKWGGPQDDGAQGGRPQVGPLTERARLTIVCVQRPVK